MILGDVITEVRDIIQDQTTTYRYGDTFLLSLCNQGLKRIQMLRPDLFAYSGTVTCTEGQVVQSGPADSMRIIEIYSVVGGNAVTEVTRETLDRNNPTWPIDAGGPAINWMRNVRSPNKFFIYPQAPSSQVLNLEYSQVPPTYDSSTAVALLADTYFPAMVDIVVFLAESIDNEHVTTGRAKMFYDMFLAELGATSAALRVTDTENAGQPEENKVV